MNKSLRNKLIAIPAVILATMFTCGQKRVVTPPSTLEYKTEQLFVASNEELNKKKIENKGYCYFIVHPGSTASNMTASELVNKETEKYGDYARYSANLASLIEFLKNSNELTIFLLGKDDYYNINIPGKSLQPFDSSYIVVTWNRHARWEKQISTPEEIQEQTPELLFNFLQNNRVKEVRLAGEWAYWDKPGCVWQLAKQFPANFDIKGVKNCIYPISPKTDEPILKKIYTDAIDVKNYQSETDGI